jgi:hypothetical protein
VLITAVAFLVRLMVAGELTVEQVMLGRDKPPPLDTAS